MGKFNSKNVISIITKRIGELRYLHVQALPASQEAIATVIGELEKVRFVIGNLTKDKEG